jgi:hypothetical protein
VIGDRRTEVDDVLRRATIWVQGRPDIAALALVGSWARGDPRLDSDVDLVLLTGDPASYIGHDAWARELGGTEIVLTRSWGAITERRFVPPSGLEIEVGIGSSSWASTEPVDPGTRGVVTDGLVILYDPRELLTSLADVCGSRS